MTPQELRELAAELDRKAAAALERGDTAAWDKYIRQSWKAQDLADERELAAAAAKRLPGATSVVTKEGW